MSDYTPTTDEVRTAYFISETLNKKRLVQEMFAEFDRWLAENDRQVAEKALTDAADELDSYDLSLGSDKMPPEGDWHVDIGYYGEANWLRARAAALGLTAEQEGENDE